MKKRCIKCNQLKTSKEFSKNRTAPDGLQKWCSECTKKQNKEWYIKNKTYKDLRNKEWDEANKKYRQEYHRQWYLKNKEKKDKQNSDWMKANKEWSRHRAATRRAKKRNQTPSWANKQAIKDFYLNCPEGMEVDHVIPLQGKEVTGLHVEYNLQYLTPEDNRAKWNKLLKEYIYESVKRT